MASQGRPFSILHFVVVTMKAMLAMNNHDAFRAGGVPAPLMELLPCLGSFFAPSA
jgi:hypothetical protein